MMRFGTLIAAIGSLVIVTQATAADMAVKAPPIVRAAPYSWTGCYIGGVGGYNWGRSNQYYGGLVNGVPNAFLPVGFSMSGPYSVTGPQAGGTLGCNYQTGVWVFGLEGDGSWVDAKGGRRADPAAVALGLNQNFEFTTRQRWMATVRGRIGYAFAERWMIYATGGAAFGGFTLNNQNGLLIPTATRIPTKVNKTGYIVGGGLEWSPLPRWSFKLEGLWADYGKIHYGDEPGVVNGCTAGCANADVKMQETIVRAGVNFKFY